LHAQEPVHGQAGADASDATVARSRQARLGALERNSRGYEIADAGGIELLLQCCEMQDRVQSMAVQIAADGPVIRTKAGIRAHPLLKDEATGRGFIVRTLSKLGVVYAEVQNPGRPGVGFGWTGA
jgi:hypothetical protein